MFIFRSKDKTDFDVIRENHKFLWDENDEKNLDTWEKRLAKKYYDKLYREYCIADLSRYKENKVCLQAIKLFFLTPVKIKSHLLSDFSLD